VQRYILQSQPLKEAEKSQDLSEEFFDPLFPY
jgi:hypothetical protein